MQGDIANSGSTRVGNAKTHTRMTMFESVRLGQKLEVARNRPTPVKWQELSRELAIPVRTLQNQWKIHQERRIIFEGEMSLAGLEETIALYDELLASLAFEVRDGDNSAARIGAIRTMIDLLGRRLELHHIRDEQLRLKNEIAGWEKAFSVIIRTLDSLELEPHLEAALTRQLKAVIDEAQLQLISL